MNSLKTSFLIVLSNFIIFANTKKPIDLRHIVVPDSRAVYCSE